MGTAPISRRALLTGAAAGMAASSGCLTELQGLLGRQRQQQISLSIATLPADDDPYAMRITSILADNLNSVGINASIEPMDPDILLREILINHDFDLYVGRYPGIEDPDVFRSMIHSVYGEEAGWQNPFGFSNLQIDDLLAEQRTISGGARETLVQDIQYEIVREQPFTVLTFPDNIAATRSDRFIGWPRGGLKNPLTYLELSPIVDTETLTILTTDARISHNRNPLSVEHRHEGEIIGLMYDSLFRGQDQSIPWLASDIEWHDDNALSATVEIRDATWHDGEGLSANDVVFTYEFLADTSLGEFETPVPTPWKRGRLSLVESVSRRSSSAVRFNFSTNVRDIAVRALTVPILPEHIWEERAEPADIAGIDIVGGTTEALVWPNEEPIGSGPFQFVEATPDDEVLFERFEDHFLQQMPEEIPTEYHQTPAYSTLQFRIVPSQDSALELLENGEADATLGGLRESIVPRIGRAPGVQLSVAQSNTFYHIGYNCRRAPLVDPQFRRVLSRLIDREMLVRDVFAGYATPSVAPLPTSKWLPPELEWDGEAYLPFIGQDGELDEDAARAVFREAGYIYDDGQMVSRGET